MPSFPSFVSFGALHHATFSKQAPPLGPDAFRAFLRRELEQMKKTGLNTFNVHCAWAEVEGAQDRWDFTYPDIARDLCVELDFSIALWLWPELTPRWFLRQHPEAAAVAASGYKTRSHSIGSTVARAHVRRFLHAALARYAQSPRLIAYNVAIEGGLWWNQKPDTNNADDRLWDYSPDMLRAWPPWLERRYGRIEQLNILYRTLYERFDEIEAPRARYFRETAMTTNQVPWLDWCRFVCETYTDYVRFKMDVIRQIDSERPIIDHTHQVDPSFWGQDLWALARQADGVGVSMFTSDTAGDYMSTNWLMDRHRSAARGKPLWLWELRSGQTTWGISNWGIPMDGADIGRFTWQALANGATGIQYWNWRPHMGGIEVGGHGLVDRDGSPTDRSQRAGAIARQVADGLPLRVAPVEAAVAILDDPRSRVLAAGEGSDAEVVAAQRDVYAALRSQGFAVDFVDEDDVLRALPARIRVLCLPFAYTLPRAVADRLAAWVRAGGVLFGGLFCGVKDEHGFGQDRVPGHDLDQVFGCREIRVLPCFDEADAQTSTLGSAYQVPMTGRPALRVVEPLRPGGHLAPGTTLSAYKFIQELKPFDGARVVATTQDGRPVVVSHNYGQGRTLYFGSLFGRCGDFADDGLARLLADLVASENIVPPVQIAARGDKAIEARLLTGKTEALLVAINSEGTPQTVTLQINHGTWKKAFDYMTSVAIAVSNNTITLEIPARDARAVRLESTP